MNFALVGALVGVALVTGCAGETEGPATLDCDTCPTSLPQRNGQATTDPVLTPTPNPNQNVARPVTPATPPSSTGPATTTTTAPPPPPPAFTTKPITRKYLDG